MSMPEPGAPSMPILACETVLVLHLNAGRDVLPVLHFVRGLHLRAYLEVVYRRALADPDFRAVLEHETLLARINRFDLALDVGGACDTGQRQSQRQRTDDRFAHVGLLAFRRC